MGVVSMFFIISIFEGMVDLKKLGMKKLCVFLSIVIASYTTSFCQDDYFLYWDFNDKKEMLSAI